MNSPAGMRTNSIPMLLRRVSNNDGGAGMCVAGGYTPTATWGPNDCCPLGAGGCGVAPSLLAVPDDGGSIWGVSEDGAADATVLPEPAK